jgi:hypothetical protein
MSDSKSQPRIALAEENHLWLKYFTIMANLAGIVSMAAPFFIRGAQLGLLLGPLVIVGSIYTLRVTGYFRRWDSQSSVNKIVGSFVILYGVGISIYTFFLIPLIKPFTDQLGKGEPRKLGDTADRIIYEFRRLTNDPTLVVSSPKHTIEQPTSQQVQVTEQPVVIKEPAMPPVMKTEKSSQWLLQWKGHPFESSIIDNTTVYTISVPKSVKWEPEQALSLMKHLLTTFGRMTFQIAAGEGQIIWQVVDIGNTYSPQVMIPAILSVYPGAEVVHSTYTSPEVVEPFNRLTVVYKQTNGNSAKLAL